jgi:hypothetical protein
MNDKRGPHFGAQRISMNARELEACDVFLLAITPHSWAAEWL